MGEERPVPCAQVVEPCLPVRRLDEPVLGAASVANESHGAFLAVTCQRVQLVLAELALLLRRHQLHHRRLGDVTQKTVRLHKVITGVEVPGVLQRQSGAAGRGKDAQRGGCTDPRCEGYVKDLYEHTAHVAPYPLVKDAGQKPAVLFRAHRPAGNGVPLLEAGLVVPLYNGDELYELCPQVIPEITIHLSRMITVRRVDGAQDVDIYVVFLQVFQALQHPRRRGPAPFVHAVDIVHVWRTVDAEPDQKVMLLEEGAPFVVQLCAIGLHRMLQGCTGGLVLLSQLNRPPEEVQPHQGRLTALPGDGDLGDALRLEILPQILLQHLVGHAELAAGVELFLGQEEAVLAVQIADCACRLGQKVERRGQVSSGSHRRPILLVPERPGDVSPDRRSA